VRNYFLHRKINSSDLHIVGKLLEYSSESRGLEIYGQTIEPKNDYLITSNGIKNLWTKNIQRRDFP
jgi:hypothetical protein